MNIIKTSKQELANTSSRKLIKANVILAITRTNGNIREYDLDVIANTFEQAFPKVPHVHIAGALENGSLGVYGKTYRLSMQEMCIWVREYLKELPVRSKSKMKPLKIV